MTLNIGQRTSSATGGSISTITGFTIHTFTTGGNFVPSGSGIIEVLVVGGGGANVTASPNTGGGGGGGAVVYNKFLNVTSGTPYVITVGPVGVAGAVAGSSACFGITAAGGGAGGSAPGGQGISSLNASGGGSGGGNTPLSGGTGAGISGLGFPGGAGGANSPAPAYSGGGGGAAGAGGTGGISMNGTGGIGVSYSITGVSSYYGAGAGARIAPVSFLSSNGGIPGASYGLGGTPGAVIIRYPS